MKLFDWLYSNTILNSNVNIECQRSIQAKTRYFAEIRRFTELLANEFWTRSRALVQFVGFFPIFNFSFQWQGLFFFFFS